MLQCFDVHVDKATLQTLQSTGNARKVHYYCKRQQQQQEEEDSKERKETMGTRSQWYQKGSRIQDARPVRFALCVCVCVCACVRARARCCLFVCFRSAIVLGRKRMTAKLTNRWILVCQSVLQKLALRLSLVRQSCAMELLCAL